MVLALGSLRLGLGPRLLSCIELDLGLCVSRLGSSAVDLGHWPTGRGFSVEGLSQFCVPWSWDVGHVFWALLRWFLLRGWVVDFWSWVFDIRWSWSCLALFWETTMQDKNRPRLHPSTRPTGPAGRRAETATAKMANKTRWQRGRGNSQQDVAQDAQREDHQEQPPTQKQTTTSQKTPATYVGPLPTIIIIVNAATDRKSVV